MSAETHSWQENHLQNWLSQPTHVTWHPPSTCYQMSLRPLTQIIDHTHSNIIQYFFYIYSQVCASSIHFPKCNQRDATFRNLFISTKRSTHFRRFLHPSSGAQTVHTASGIVKLCCYLLLSWLGWNWDGTGSIPTMTAPGTQKHVLLYRTSIIIPAH
jgi:hypothetical protein